MPIKAKAAVAQKMPDKPTHCSKAAPDAKAMEKDKPILIPIPAMALVRCSSRVKSAVRAITAAEIAPLPCSNRPRITI